MHIMENPEVQGNKKVENMVTDLQETYLIYRVSTNLRN